MKKNRLNPTQDTTSGKEGKSLLLISADNSSD